jgi:ADP-L-glycero-D-manno-heptose 6-epimerase
MIIVTGATGFIGSAMVWQLNNRGISSILAVDTVPPSVRPGPLSNRRFDRFIEKDDFWAYLENVKLKASVTAVVHMGACSSTTELNTAFLKENNFLYTKKLWQWCAENQKPFIYASSGAVYGAGDQGFDDGSPSKNFKPLNPYGESKAMFDRWVENEILNPSALTPPYWYGLRFFNVFGPNEYLKADMASVVFKAFHQIRNTGRLKLFKSHRADYKDGEQLRDFVYVKDIVRWMDELVLRATGQSVSGLDPAQSGIYNMGFGKARSWNDLASATFRALEKPVAIDYIDIPVDMRPRYQYYTQANMVRLIGLKLSHPEWPLEKAVQDYVANHLANHSGSGDPWL